MKRTGRKVLSILCLGLYLQFTGCLATMDTARVKKGMNHAVTIDIVHIDNNKSTPYWVDYTHTHSGIMYRPSYGFRFGENYGLEVGLKLGVYTDAVIGGEAVQKDGKWDISYYPISSYYRKTLKQFVKLGLFQSNPVKAALIAEFGWTRPAAFGLIVSKEGKQTTPYFSVKAFNRFIFSAEDKIQNETNWGEMVSAGVEIKTGKTMIFTKKKIDLYAELGLLSDYWYGDNISKMLGLGFKLR